MKKISGWLKNVVMTIQVDLEEKRTNKEKLDTISEFVSKRIKKIPDTKLTKEAKADATKTLIEITKLTKEKDSLEIIKKYCEEILAEKPKPKPSKKVKNLTDFYEDIKKKINDEIKKSKRGVKYKTTVGHIRKICEDYDLTDLSVEEKKEAEDKITMISTYTDEEKNEPVDAFDFIKGYVPHLEKRLKEEIKKVDSSIVKEIADELKNEESTADEKIKKIQDIYKKYEY